MIRITPREGRSILSISELIFGAFGSQEGGSRAEK